jgi:hypothetical protein
MVANLLLVSTLQAANLPSVPTTLGQIVTDVNGTAELEGKMYL